MSYFDIALEPKRLRSIAKDAKTILKILGVKVENVIGRGSSGLIALPTFAEVLKAQINICRKPNDSSHSSRIIESLNHTALTNWVIIDDFVSSGATVQAIIDEVKSLHDKEGWAYSPPVALITYDGSAAYSKLDCPQIGFMLDSTRPYSALYNVNTEHTRKIIEALPNWRIA